MHSVIKTRMQSLEARKNYRNSFHCASRIFKEEGILRCAERAHPGVRRLYGCDAQILARDDAKIGTAHLLGRYRLHCEPFPLFFRLRGLSSDASQVYEKGALLLTNLIILASLDARVQSSCSSVVEKSRQILQCTFAHIENHGALYDPLLRLLTPLLVDRRLLPTLDRWTSRSSSPTRRRIITPR